MFGSLFIDIDFSESLKLPSSKTRATMIALVPWSHHRAFWHGKTSRRKSYHPYVSDDKKSTTQHLQHMSSKKCLKQWRIYPKVASSKVTTVLLNVNQPSISTISRIFVKRSMSPSFAYSLWPDMVKGRSTMLGDWQNTLHVHMWEQRVKFLMPLLYRFSWN